MKKITPKLAKIKFMICLIGLKLGHGPTNYGLDAFSSSLCLFRSLLTFILEFFDKNGNFSEKLSFDT